MPTTPNLAARARVALTAPSPAQSLGTRCSYLTRHVRSVQPLHLQGPFLEAMAQAAGGSLLFASEEDS